MFLRNDLIEYVDPEPRIIRLLWLHPTKQFGFAIDINAHDAVPELVQLESLESELRSERSRLLTEDPCQTFTEEASFSESRKIRRDQAWQIIVDLVRDEPDIFLAGHRAFQLGFRPVPRSICTFGGTGNVVRHLTHCFRIFRSREEKVKSVSPTPQLSVVDRVAWATYLG